MAANVGVREGAVRNERKHALTARTFLSRIDPSQPARRASRRERLIHVLVLSKGMVPISTYLISADGQILLQEKTECDSALVTDKLERRRRNAPLMAERQHHRAELKIQ